jgi:fermentation-respiration switch protein FrsA (DUF1100 family)
MFFLGLVYLGVIIVFYSLESTLVFHPSSADESWLNPVDSKTEDINLIDSTGTKLHGWWLPPDRPVAGAVLVAHGNGGNISHRGQLAANLRRALGTGVLLIEYPGYGKSDGNPSEPGCYLAGDAGYRWLIDEAKVPPGRVVLMGESLGGGVAVDLATRHDHRALVLLFTFTSLPAAAKFHYPWLPTYTLMRSRFDNLAKIPRCPRPVFIAHGTADQVVPFGHAEILLAAANEPKELLRMEDIGHGGLGEGAFRSLGKFLDTHAP